MKNFIIILLALILITKSNKNDTCVRSCDVNCQKKPAAQACIEIFYPYQPCFLELPDDFCTETSSDNSTCQWQISEVSNFTTCLKKNKVKVDDVKHLNVVFFDNSTATTTRTETRETSKAGPTSAGFKNWNIFHLFVGKKNRIPTISHEISIFNSNIEYLWTTLQPGS
ncbi:hypothetical protein HDU92_006522 [Lobulomyces angularis]|nr:hypothetical protein HDU92_006522 [Lobulomyces angularis]